MRRAVEAGNNFHVSVTATAWLELLDPCSWSLCPSRFAKGSNSSSTFPSPLAGSGCFLWNALFQFDLTWSLVKCCTQGLVRRSALRPWHIPPQEEQMNINWSSEWHAI